MRRNPRLERGFRIAGALGALAGAEPVFADEPPDESKVIIQERSPEDAKAWRKAHGIIIPDDLPPAPIPEFKQPPAPGVERIKTREKKIAPAPPGEYDRALVKSVEGHKTVLYTFDDGPDLKYTPQVLDILKDAGVKATFFVKGENITPKTKNLLLRIVAEGHQIALHSFDHPHMEKDPDAAAAVDKQVTKVREQLKAVTGIDSNIFRPPGGTLSPEQTKLLIKQGYRIVRWREQVDTKDWDSRRDNRRNHPRGPRNSVDNIVETAMQADAGDIILTHDGGRHPNTIAAYPQIIEFFKNAGVVPITVNQALAFEPVPHEQVQSALQRPNSAETN